MKRTYVVSEDKFRDAPADLVDAADRTRDAWFKSTGLPWRKITSYSDGDPVLAGHCREAGIRLDAWLRAHPERKRKPKYRMQQA